MTTLSHSLSHGSAAAQSGINGLKKLWSAYWLHRRQRTTMLLLQSLDARTLQDIGIDRSEIRSVVHSLYRGGDRRSR
jgi:uncharacterized protein YjiS (DUF1127 family)